MKQAMPAVAPRDEAPRSEVVAGQVEEAEEHPASPWTGQRPGVATTGACGPVD